MTTGETITLTTYAAIFLAVIFIVLESKRSDRKFRDRLKKIQDEFNAIIETSLSEAKKKKEKEMEAHSFSLDELWEIARQYGQVSIHTMSDGDYYASIEFHSMEHTILKAKSGSYCKTPNSALKEAIEAAEKIVESVKQLPERKLLT